MIICSVRWNSSLRTKGAVLAHQMDAASRTFTFSAQRGKHDVTLTMRFPDAYPLRSVPTFSVGAMTSLSRSAQDKLLAVSTRNSLKGTAGL